MRKLTILGAAAILATTAALPSLAQAASCAQYDPTCATYPMPGKSAAHSQGAMRVDASYQRQSHARSTSRRTMQREAMNRDGGQDRDRSGFWPADVAGAAIGTAGGIALGAVDTAGAIATAPFRGADSYAYYNTGGYNNGGYGGYDNGYNGWDNQSYAERNGFVCTPGTLFKGADGRLHPCQ